MLLDLHPCRSRRFVSYLSFFEKGSRALHQNNAYGIYLDFSEQRFSEDIHDNTPQQLKRIGATLNHPYGKTGTHDRCSRPSASASWSRFRRRHLHQSMVHLEGRVSHSPGQTS
jgi:hypothetical protein